MKDKNIIIAPTREYSPYSQCYGKKQYKLKRRALQDIKILATVNPDETFTVYECPHCHKFHVGTVRQI